MVCDCAIQITLRVSGRLGYLCRLPFFTFRISSLPVAIVTSTADEFVVQDPDFATRLLPILAVYWQLKSSVSSCLASTILILASEGESFFPCALNKISIKTTTYTT